MASEDTPQNMAAMSCCPGGAVAMLGVGLGRMLATRFERFSTRRARRREIALLTRMWDTEYVAPTSTFDQGTDRTQLDH